MTVEALASYCQVPEKTVYTWLHTGTGPRSYKIGKYRRFRRADVEAWLESRGQ